MKFFIGLLLAIVGVFLGLYVGGWLCFIGGICDIINEIKADDLVALNVAIGAAKVFGCTIAGGVSATVFIAPGVTLMND
jgi:hypothetical protein